MFRFQKSIQILFASSSFCFETRSYPRVLSNVKLEILKLSDQKLQKLQYPAIVKNLHKIILRTTEMSFYVSEVFWSRAAKKTSYTDMSNSGIFFHKSERKLRTYAQ